MSIETHVALYWDFENVHASLHDAMHGLGTYGKQQSGRAKPLVRVDAIVDFAASHGTLVINRAYADWRAFGAYKADLLARSVDTIQLFPLGFRGKNGADIRMALDVLEDVQSNPHITHVVLVTGDGDFVALAQKCRKAGRTVIGLGVESSTNKHWASACNEFKYYRSVIARALPAAADSSDIPEEATDHGALTTIEAKKLLAQSVYQLATNHGVEWVVKAAVRPMMVRLDSTFDEARLGFRSFAAFVTEARDIVNERRGTHDNGHGTLRLDHPHR